MNLTLNTTHKKTHIDGLKPAVEFVAAADQYFLGNGQMDRVKKGFKI